MSNIGSNQNKLIKQQIPNCLTVIPGSPQINTTPSNYDFPPKKKTQTTKKHHLFQGLHGFHGARFI